MKGGVVILWLAVAGLSYAAGAAHTLQFPPHLSDAQFLKQWRGTGNVQSQLVIEQQRYAQGYLDGVVDLTQGKGWCSPGDMEPGERDDRVTTALSKRPAGANAAQSLLAHYRATFPCQ